MFNLMTAVFLLLAFVAKPIFASDSEFISYAKARVASATSVAHKWDGPTIGPFSQIGKKIVFVASNLRNGGVNGVAQGVSEAASHTQWDLRFIDALGSEVRQGAAIRRAVAMNPDGIILGGIDIEHHKEVLKVAKKLGISLVGWHASDSVEGNEEFGLFANITTDPMEVAEISALMAIAESSGDMKVALFTDNRYSIATLKANVMRKTVERCTTCVLVDSFDIPLDKAANNTHKVVTSLISEENVTHILAINDLYIDFAIPVYEQFQSLGLRVPVNISAGDGSMAAYQRIKKDHFQLATVPEPLYMQGWQVIDELNRSFNQSPPSGYIAPVHIITQENVSELIGKTGVYDPKNNYREAYLSIWLDKEGETQ
ncbi:substrate-binding domain-containing protein [Marinomonas balearica]|uniref:Monosaccharide ABC transporter substrate-binding protein (CUT2 family) n=1 Tax=Marinomonas balearica TaxID=491947 RepID=A0A4R6M6X3_9GAMM|nr:substrate-binding domain-containing protein [Marinomonas balearica]TDO96866.1 monosaccharide ABC transporter substrate-binding protein (CUT2 family) [Marinomonas balearica]